MCSARDGTSTVTSSKYHPEEDSRLSWLTLTFSIYKKRKTQGNKKFSRLFGAWYCFFLGVLLCCVLVKIQYHAEEWKIWRVTLHHKIPDKRIKIQLKLLIASNKKNSKRKSQRVSTGKLLVLEYRSCLNYEAVRAGGIIRPTQNLIIININKYILLAFLTYLICYMYEEFV